MNWKKLGKAVWIATIVALVAYLGVVGIQYLLNHAKWAFGVIAFGLVVVGVYWWDYGYFHPIAKTSWWKKAFRLRKK